MDEAINNLKTIRDFLKRERSANPVDFALHKLQDFSRPAACFAVPDRSIQDRFVRQMKNGFFIALRACFAMSRREMPSQTTGRRDKSFLQGIFEVSFKRIALLILTNIAIVVMLGIVLNVVSMLTGLNFGQMAGSSLNMTSLFVFALVVGFAGSIISLLMSKTMARTSMGVQLLNTENPAPGLEAWLVGVIRQQADKLGVKMPEVGIYEGEPNAFATGATKNSSMVAVSTGLLQMMNQKEVEAVLAHEMSHVANGDMVTMTLVQGVMNTFVVFISRVVGWVVDRQILRNESDGPGAGYFVTSLVLDIALGFLAGMVVAAFSRHREYRADEGAARVMGESASMISALQRLGTMQPAELPASVKGLGISGGIGSLFASHPSIEDRIDALRRIQM